MSDALPGEVLEFLVRTVPSRDFWQWLSEATQSQLRFRVIQGFRASAESLRQPVVRARLVTHLQNSEEDTKALLKLWGKSTPPVLAAIRDYDDIALFSELPALQAKHGDEAVSLALLHEDRESILETWIEQSGNDESMTDVELGLGVSTPDRHSAETQKKLQRAQSRVEQFRAKANEAKSRAAAIEKQLKARLREQDSVAREAQREARQATLKAERLETKLADVEKVRDRAERKERSTQAELEAAQAELKTLRKQLHRLQQVNEELRSRLAASQAKVNGNTTEKRQAEATVQETDKPATPSGNVHLSSFAPSDSANLEELEIAKITDAIDRNDEKFVAALREDLSILQTRNEVLYKKLLKAIRNFGSYYARVLTIPTARVLVDASNVARHNAIQPGKLEYLIAMREELRHHDFFPILFIADASLPYHINDKKRLRAMIARDEIVVTASGQQADEVLARQAKETGAYVVTNDRNFHFAFTPTLAPSRIGFRIEEDVVLLEDF